MAVKELEHGTMYTGSPSDILMDLSAKIAKVLQEAGIAPTGIHTLALLHVACCAICSGREYWDKGERTLGQMPSFKTTLTLLTRVTAGETMSEEETEAFYAEFVQMIRSLGGEAQEMTALSPSTGMAMPLSPMPKEMM